MSEPGPDAETVTGLFPELPRPIEITGRKDDRSVMSSLRTGGTYEPHLLALLKRIAQPEWVVLDIGANIGVISTYLAELCDRGQVYAFEPIPESAAFLEHNVAANNADNVVVVKAAITDRSGNAEFNYLPQYAAGAFLAPEGATDGVAVSAPTSSLDDWVVAHPLERVDLIKVDVEGAEMQVLDGAEQTIQSHRPDLVVELNPVTLKWLHANTWSELVRRLEATYPHVFHIAQDGSVFKPRGRAHWLRLLALWGHTDVYCSWKPPADVTSGHRGRARRDFREHRRDFNSDVAPTHCLVVEPLFEFVPSSTTVTGRPGETVQVPLRLVNRSELWLSSDLLDHPVHLSYRWLDEKTGKAAEGGEYQRLPEPVARGGSSEVTLEIRLPDVVGERALMPTLNQSDFAWLDDLQDRQPGAIEVRVTDDP